MHSRVIADGGLFFAPIATVHSCFKECVGGCTAWNRLFEKQISFWNTVISTKQGYSSFLLGDVNGSTRRHEISRHRSRQFSAGCLVVKFIRINQTGRFKIKRGGYHGPVTCSVDVGVFLSCTPYSIIGMTRSDDVAGSASTVYCKHCTAPCSRGTVSRLPDERLQLLWDGIYLERKRPKPPVDGHGQGEAEKWVTAVG